MEVVKHEIEVLFLQVFILFIEEICKELVIEVNCEVEENFRKNETNIN